MITSILKRKIKDVIIIIKCVVLVVFIIESNRALSYYTQRICKYDVHISTTNMTCNSYNNIIYITVVFCHSLQGEFMFTLPSKLIRGDEHDSFS